MAVASFSRIMRWVTKQKRVPGSFEEHNNKFVVLTWPLNSPGLNPIEHVCDVQDKQVRSMVAPPRNLQDLKDLLLTSWCQIPQHTLRVLGEGWGLFWQQKLYYTGDKMLCLIGVFEYVYAVSPVYALCGSMALDFQRRLKKMANLTCTQWKHYTLSCLEIDHYCHGQNHGQNHGIGQLKQNLLLNTEYRGISHNFTEMLFLCGIGTYVWGKLHGGK